jgi:excisionase family DNA binding protein
MIRSLLEGLRVPALMTRKEVAELARVTEMTVIRWGKADLLTVHRIGRQVRYFRSEVFGLLGLPEPVESPAPPPPFRRKPGRKKAAARQPATPKATRSAGP